MKRFTAWGTPEWLGCDPSPYGEWVRFTDAQAAIAAAEARGYARGVEDAARVASTYGSNPGMPDGKTGAFRKHRHQIAAAVRALIPAERTDTRPTGHDKEG